MSKNNSGSVDYKEWSVILKDLLAFSSIGAIAESIGQHRTAMTNWKKFGIPIYVIDDAVNLVKSRKNIIDKAIAYHESTSSIAERFENNSMLHTIIAKNPEIEKVILTGIYMKEVFENEDIARLFSGIKCTASEIATELKLTTESYEGYRSRFKNTPVLNLFHCIKYGLIANKAIKGMEVLEKVEIPKN